MSYGLAPAPVPLSDSGKRPETQEPVPMKYNRRESLLTLGTVAGSLSANQSIAANPRHSIHANPLEQKFRYCLNTSTIRGQKTGILKEVEIAAAAGYDGIEPWIPNLREFRDQGGSISDLSKRIADSGLTVDSAIGFAQWIHPDQATRTQALEEARKDMDMLKQLGGTRIAAPPVGISKICSFVVIDSYFLVTAVSESSNLPSSILPFILTSHRSSFL